jgi:aminoglycoside 3-N-acetyltransferase
LPITKLIFLIGEKMTIKSIINKTKTPNTISSLKKDFIKLGVSPGNIILMHSSLSKLGWTVGGPVAVLESLMEILTTEGTLVIPSFTYDNNEPSNWQNPPVPKPWWEIIRKEMPAFHPDKSITTQMGIIAETFRKFPNVSRSSHPHCSFTAWGKYAKFITNNHALFPTYGDESPLAKVYQLQGKILLLGVNHESNTSLHYAEYKSNLPIMIKENKGAAIVQNSNRKWVQWEEMAYSSIDFMDVGLEYEKSIGYIPQKVGKAETRFLSQPVLVDFAIEWFKKHRKNQTHF